MKQQRPRRLGPLHCPPHDANSLDADVASNRKESRDA